MQQALPGFVSWAFPSCVAEGGAAILWETFRMEACEEKMGGEGQEMRKKRWGEVRHAVPSFLFRMGRKARGVSPAETCTLHEGT